MSKKEIQLEVDSTLIYQPRYVDDKKVRIKAIVRSPDGRFAEFEGNKNDKRSPLVRDIFLQYSEDEIECFTEREGRVQELKARIDQQTAEDRRRAEEREVTFQAKTKALELPEVKNCPDKRLARNIRRAKSAFEVAGWLAVVFQQSLDNDSKPDA